MGKFSVIFDMDGTLLDSQRVYIPAWEYAGDIQGLKNLGRHLPEVCGMSEAGWTQFLCDRYPSIDIKKFVVDMFDYKTKHATVTFMKGAREVLDFLHSKNVPLAVASGSNTKAVTSALDILGVYDYFDAIVGGEQVENGKPAPDIFLKAAKGLGAKPEDCFVVEDSSNGVLAGARAGMRCIAVPDIAPIDDEIKKSVFAEISNLNEAIQIFQRELEK